jgi:hypothetical protein
VNDFTVEFVASDNEEGEPIIVVKLGIRPLNALIHMDLDVALDLTGTLNSALIDLLGLLPADGEIMQ